MANTITALRPRWRDAGSVLGPEALRTAQLAYDMAWSEIAAEFGDNPSSIQGAQLRLANAVLLVAGDHIHDPKYLKGQALRVMAAKLQALGA